MLTTFNISNVRLQCDISRGFTGTDSGMGAQGPPGDVSNAQLSTAINGTSSNSNAKAMLGMTVSDQPTQGEMQAMANKLIDALRQ